MRTSRLEIGRVVCLVLAEVTSGLFVDITNIIGSQLGSICL